MLISILDCNNWVHSKQWSSEGWAWPGTCPAKAPRLFCSCHAILHKAHASGLVSSIIEVTLFSGLPHCYSLFYIHKWERPGNTYHTRWKHLPHDLSHQHKLWVVHLFHVRSVQYLTFSFRMIVRQFLLSMLSQHVHKPTASGEHS